MEPAAPSERWTVLLAGRGWPQRTVLVARPRRLPRWVIPASLAVLAVVFGTVGSLMREYPESDSSPFFHALYNAIRCFSLNGPAEGDLAWPMDICRFLAPLATVWAAVAAFAALTATRRRERRVLGGRGHTIVCGLGRKGTRLALESLAAGERVVAIERDETNHGVEHFRALGAVVLVGDATDAALLARAGVARAGLLLSTLPHDRSNLSVALAASAAATAERPRGYEPLQVFVHCGDLEFQEAARRHRVLASRPETLRVQYFNRDEAAARILATDHLPAAVARAAREGRPPHLALVGLGWTGEAALVRILQSPVVDAYPAWQVTVVDRRASAQAERLLARRRLRRSQNGVGDLCTLVPVDRDLVEAHDLFEALREVHVARPLDAVVVCLGDPELMSKCAIEARGGALPGVPFFLRFLDSGGVGDLLAEAPLLPSGSRAATVFGEDHEVCSRAVVVDAALDALARRIHDDYRNQRLAEQPGKADDAQVPWAALDPDLARSNVSQADHIPAKLAVLGRRATRGAPAGEPPPFSPDEVETLARIEHARWAAERILAGWRHAPGKKDLAARTNPHLVPWDLLDERIRDYDREPVRRIPRQLALLGLGVSTPRPGS